LSDDMPKDTRTSDGNANLTEEERRRANIENLIDKSRLEESIFDRKRMGIEMALTLVNDRIILTEEKIQVQESVQKERCSELLSHYRSLLDEARTVTQRFEDAVADIGLWKAQNSSEAGTNDKSMGQYLEGKRDVCHHEFEAVCGKVASATTTLQGFDFSVLK
ncbi:hypothetical protein LTR72_012231, partial [Exophiala xenobiotica]